MLIYVSLFLLLRLFYNPLSSLLGPVHSLSKYLGLFIAKALAGRYGFSRPILIKGRL